MLHYFVVGQLSIMAYIYGAWNKHSCMQNTILSLKIVKIGTPRNKRVCCTLPVCMACVARPYFSSAQ